MGIKKGNIAMLNMMAMAMSSNIYTDGYNDLFREDEQPKRNREPKPIKKIIPKGVKEYFFNKNGGFSTTQMRRDECVFKCLSLNDKNAIRKFKKYQKHNASL